MSQPGVKASAMAWIRREDLEGLQAYTKSIGEDLAKRSAWCAWMLDHLFDRDDWQNVRDEFEAAWRVRKALERPKEQTRIAALPGVMTPEQARSTYAARLARLDSLRSWAELAKKEEP